MKLPLSRSDSIPWPSTWKTSCSSPSSSLDCTFLVLDQLPLCSFNPRSSQVYKNIIRQHHNHMPANLSQETHELPETAVTSSLHPGTHQGRNAWPLIEAEIQCRLPQLGWQLGHILSARQGPSTFLAWTLLSRVFLNRLAQHGRFPWQPPFPRCSVLPSSTLVPAAPSISHWSSGVTVYHF